MPTYEYTCEKCNQHFDFLQSIKDKALTQCPKEACRMKKWGKGKVKRGITAGAGLIFKGTGFYITDYRSEKYKEAAKKDSGAASPPPPAADAKPKAEAKPASTNNSAPPAKGKKEG